MAYLDHAATTPMHPRAAAAMVAELGRVGNASSVHDAGRAARRVVEESRELIAARLGAHPTEVVFTGGGTEADNLAVKGLYWARSGADAGRRRVLVSAVEHHAVLDPALWLAEHDQARVVVLPVDGAGRIDLAVLDAELAQAPDQVALVSVMWANNEVGTVQPVAEAVELAAQHGVPVHSDAVQAVGQVPVDFAASGLAALSLSGHKLGGPAGVGALLVRRDAELTPVLHGGGQERGLRSGSLPVAAIRGLAVAIDIAVGERTERAERLASLRDALLAGVRDLVPDALLRGAPPGPGRLPGNAHFTFPGCDSDALLYLLDSHGVQCSAGSACQAGVTRPSHVLLAMGVSDAEARGALRFSLGATSTRGDVDAVVGVIRDVVARARAATG
jgi:cysteine desulfurase